MRGELLIDGEVEEQESILFLLLLEEGEELEEIIIMKDLEIIEEEGEDLDKIKEVLVGEVLEIDIEEEVEEEVIEVIKFW